MNDPIIKEMDANHKDHCARVFLTNARSLAPKMTAMIDEMMNLHLHFACVTETWFKEDRRLDGELIDIEESAGVKIFQRSRSGGKGRGGGVAFLFNKSLGSFKQRRVKGVGKHEVLCAVGKIGKIDRCFVVFTVYIPPRMLAAEFEDLCNKMEDAIAEMKKSLKDPVFILAGDFNGRDMGRGVCQTECLKPVNSGPTRGTRTLDIIYTNVEEHVEYGTTTDPIETENGTPSDHRSVFAEFVFPRVKNFEWERVTVRRRTDEADKKFGEELAGVDWTGLDKESTCDEMVGAFEKQIETLTDKHYPLVSVRKRTNEPPWITNGIR